MVVQPKGEEIFCTFSGFARVAGVSQQSISKAVASGRLTAYQVGRRKMLKPFEAARDWDANRVRIDGNYLNREPRRRKAARRAKKGARTAKTPAPAMVAQDED
jgi:hypothetical protein